MPSTARFSASVLAVCLLTQFVTTTGHAQEPETGSMSVVIDARDLPRSLLHATLRIPLDAAAEAQKIPLWYPKWVPGSHGPGGPISNVAGIRITDPAGTPLAWTRTPGEVYRLEVDVPAETATLQIEVRYIANQPTTNSMGHDVFSGSKVGVISPGAVLFYREGVDIDEAMIDTELLLPAGWQVSSALQSVDSPGGHSTRYASSTLRTYVDSPIMCGLHRRVYSLIEPAEEGKIAPHRLHVFSESAAGVDMNEDVVDRLRHMVTQTARLIGSQPFDQFEVLLAATDQIPANGLEHSRSTLNVLPLRDLASLSGLKGWSRLLIPHEYLHTWCGKYRRPAEMATTDFHSPKGTDLLWVYEGLTQYLGELIEARCGLMNKDEFRHRLAVELRNATHQHNRQWRSLADTAVASHVLRDGSPTWSRLRGGQDYYMEGMLFWLEVDARLRAETQGQKSIDDFCQLFFQADMPKYTAVASPPKPFDRAEVVASLSGLADYDWDGLIRRRVESPQQVFQSDLPQLLGYRLELSKQTPRIPPTTFRFPGGIDLYDSLGMTLSGDGRVRDIMLGSPADDAKLSPGLKVVGVNNLEWSSSGMLEALRQAENSTQTIELLVSEDGVLRTKQLHYHDGPKYLTLLRDESRPDVLEQILEKR